jgi:hypothetical protein
LLKCGADGGTKSVLGETGGQGLHLPFLNRPGLLGLSRPGPLPPVFGGFVGGLGDAGPVRTGGFEIGGRAIGGLTFGGIRGGHETGGGEGTGVGPGVAGTGFAKDAPMQPKHAPQVTPQRTFTHVGKFSPSHYANKKDPSPRA